MKVLARLESSGKKGVEGPGLLMDGFKHRGAARGSEALGFRDPSPGLTGPRVERGYGCKGSEFKRMVQSLGWVPRSGSFGREGGVYVGLDG